MSSYQRAAKRTARSAKDRVLLSSRKPTDDTGRRRIIRVGSLHFSLHLHRARLFCYKEIPPGKHAGAHFSEKKNVPSTPPFLGNLQNETWGDHRTKHERLGRKTYSRRPWNRVPRRPQRRTKNSRESARAPVATRDTSPKPSRPPAVVGLPRLATRSPLSLPSPEARNLRDGGSQPSRRAILDTLQRSRALRHSSSLHLLFKTLSPAFNTDWTWEKKKNPPSNKTKQSKRHFSMLRLWLTPMGLGVREKRRARISFSPPAKIKEGKSNSPAITTSPRRSLITRVAILRASHPTPSMERSLRKRTRANWRE